VRSVARSSIRAYFNVDLAQLRGYRLPVVAERLLIALALYKIRRFLEEGLRLRTACDFAVTGELKATSPATLVVPESAELASLLPTLIAEARKVKDLMAPAVLRLTTKTVRKAGKSRDETTDDDSEVGG